MKHTTGTVLLSCYACDPRKDSEPGYGWAAVSSIAQRIEAPVIVVTRRKNIPHIVGECEKIGISNIIPSGIEAPRLLQKLKRGHLGVHYYYYVWQLFAFFHARQLCREFKVTLAHHITFMTLRTNFVPFLVVPNLVGPVGGAQLPPFGKDWRKILGFKDSLRTFSILLMRCSPIWRAFIKRIDRLIIANSDNEWIIQNIGRRPIETFQIPSYAKLYKPQSNAVSECSNDVEELRVLWLSRLERWKGLELLLRAIQGVKGDVPIKLSVVGRGHDLEYFESATRSLGICEQVSFLGFISEDQKFEALSSADVCVFTSLHETTGTTIFEYMEFGKPIIALNCGGASSILDDQCAFLVSDLSSVATCVEGIAEALKTIFRDRAGAAHVGEMARLRLNSKFRGNVFVDQILACYDDVLKRLELN